MKLRDYQEEAVKRIRESFRVNKSVLFRLDTGGGKSAILSYISMLCSNGGKHVMILVHRKNLVSQISSALAAYGVMHDVIASSKVRHKCMTLHIKERKKIFIDKNSRVHVCMVQTVANKPQYSCDKDLLIVDECHHSNASQYLKVIDNLKPSAKILGVTATPKRQDGKGLGEVFQDLIEVISMKELIQQGYLCVPITYAAPVEYANNKLHKSMGDYNVKELAEDANNKKIYGDAIAHYRKICDKVPAIAFCINVAESKKVAQDFRNAGYNAVSIDGSMDDDQINDALDGLASGKYHVVCACDLISEGTDVPLVGCVIQLRRTCSIVLQQQQIGRALRLYPDCELMKQPHMQCLIRDGKHVAYILDHANNFDRFGFVHKDRVWSLDGSVEDAEKAEAIATCPECYGVHKVAPKCPYCGFEYRKKTDEVIAKSKTEIVNVNLVEMKFDWDNPESIKKASYKEVMSKVKSISDLISTANAKGYKKSWIIKQMEESARKHSEKSGIPFDEIFSSYLDKYADKMGYKKSWVSKQKEIRGIA